VRPSEFKRWRKGLKLSQKEAAHALGLKRRVVQYYEKGERDGEPVKIPKTVRLACYALWKNVGASRAGLTYAAGSVSLASNPPSELSPSSSAPP
jgi:transcriptional regulator with XRE-family HTH domain